MSRAPGTVRATVRRVALARAPQLGARGVGLKLSHVVDRVGVPSLGPGAASLSSAQLEARAEDAVAVMLDADALARRVMQAVRDRTGWPVPDTDLSLPVATTCGASVRGEGRLPTPDEEEALVHRLVDLVVDRHAQGKKLDRDAFARAAKDRYAAGWLARGGTNLSTWPPSEIGLGHDERPPLVAARTRRRGNWTQGSDRSVYTRYSLYFSMSARRRVGARHQHQCPQDERPRRDPDPLELSVDLACEPYGLEHEGHRQFLRTLAMQADQAPATDNPAVPLAEPTSTGSDGPPGRPRFVDWDEECCPAPEAAGPDQDWVEERLGSLIAHWWRDGEGRRIRDRWGDPGSYTHSMRDLVVRRVWQDLAGRERVHLDRAGTCMVDGVVKTALARAVSSELSQVLRGERWLPPAPSVQRTNATLQLLLREVATTTETPRPSPADLLSAYADLQRRAGPAAEHAYLTVTELAAVLEGAPTWEEDR